MGFAGYTAISQGLRREPLEDDRPPTAVTGIAAVVRPYEQQLTSDADGIVVPYREIEISAEVAGRITKREEVCRAGNYVEKDQLLVEIDPRDYTLEVDRLKAELRQRLSVP